MIVTLVLIFHIVVCVSLVIVVLLQQGKGAEMGAVFGGSSQTVFGARGAGNILTKVTSTLAVLFFATSLYLAYSSTQHASGSIFEHTNLPGSTAPMVNLGGPKSAPAVKSPATAPKGAPGPGAPQH